MTRCCGCIQPHLLHSRPAPLGSLTLDTATTEALLVNFFCHALWLLIIEEHTLSTYLVIFVVLVIFIISEELSRRVRDGEGVKHTAVGRDKRNNSSDNHLYLIVDD